MSDRVSDYAYELPAGLIAQHPAARRDDSRLLVIPRSGALEHRGIPDLLDLLEPGDLLVVNESRVLPARLLGRKTTGAQAEILLLSPTQPDRDPWVWEALVRPGRKLRPGAVVVVSDDLRIEILEVVPSGNRIVRLQTDLSVEEAMDRYGSMPLPPYIERAADAADRERYQTVYARESGSVAAPTAGLHFTGELLDKLEQRGIERAAVTLHVGIGTFRPVEVDDPVEHHMHRERYHVPDAVVEAIERTRARSGRVWAVGTTAVRTLEAAADPDGAVRPGWGDTDLFIRPPYDYRVVDGLLTNFHLPRSTLIMLVAALAGYDRTMDAYAEAVRERYRFYSYGDAMAVMPAPR
ncbi:MAG: tRNA preQ1(34) S-adenosylmethionine ribosyltransferase-isomerase QueA [Longimicrobiales bacterium]|nr:tRNA preQ1(34) S-adenosylmethionine ribosyltransferase-isomerase QueA [Longimicrobiales bacterium]